MAAFSTLHLFSTYSTREAYREATGQEAPPFDPRLPHKAWKDPAPSPIEPDGNVPYLMLAQTQDGVPLIDASQKPYLAIRRIHADFARRVNIPPKAHFGGDPTILDAPAPFGEIPVPVRPLLPHEELRAHAFAKVVVVDKSEGAEPAPSGDTSGAAFLDAMRTQFAAVNVQLAEIKARLDFLLAPKA